MYDQNDCQISYICRKQVGFKNGSCLVGNACGCWLEQLAKCEHAMPSIVWVGIITPYDCVLIVLILEFCHTRTQWPLKNAPDLQQTSISVSSPDRRRRDKIATFHHFLILIFSSTWPVVYFFFFLPPSTFKKKNIYVEDVWWDFFCCWTCSYYSG